jgi:hypothetical protein
VPEIPPQIPPAARKLARELTDMRARIDRLERGGRAPQLTHAALDGGALVVKDRTGTPLARLGMQHDGRAAVVYARGDPPPTPSDPVVVARQLALAVYWDGTFPGAERPTDLARVDVHVSETAVYTPDGTTLIGSLFGEGAVSFAGDNDPKYVRLVAVTTSDVASEPTAAVAATPLPADQLAAGSVGAAQLVADLVLASRIIAGTPGAARVEVDGVNNQIVAYRPDGTTQTFVLDGDTGDVTAIGEWRTGFSGARMVINEGNVNALTIRWYPAPGDTFDTSHAAIYKVDGGPHLVAVPLRDLNGNSGYMSLSDLSAHLGWGNANDPTVPDSAYCRASDGGIVMSANWPALISDPSVGPNEFQGVWLRHRDATGTLITNSDLQYTNDDGTRKRPSFRSSAGDIRLLWDNVGSELQVLNWAGSAWKPIRASDFLPPSSRRVKQNVRELPLPALDVIRAAPAKQWEYIPAPATTAHLPVDKPEQGEPTFEEVEIPAETPIPHVGPMAEDLPDWLVVESGETDGVPAVGLRDLLGTVWKAVEEIGDRLDAIEARMPARS